MVAVVSHLGGQIEGHRETSGALREQVAIAPVASFGGAEAGVLAHCPKAAAVHLPVDAASVRELARVAERVVHDREILRARRKEVTPKYSMRMVADADKTRRNRWPAAWSGGAPPSLMQARTTPDPQYTATQKKTNPITSFHRVRAGFRTAGTTCLTNSRPLRAVRCFHTPTS